MGNVAASVHVLGPLLSRKWGTEEESGPDGVLECSLDLHPCTESQLYSQTQKCVHSQRECDLAEQMVIEKRRQHRLHQQQ